MCLFAYGLSSRGCHIGHGLQISHPEPRAEMFGTEFRCTKQYRTRLGNITSKKITVVNKKTELKKLFFLFVILLLLLLFLIAIKQRTT